MIRYYVSVEAPIHGKVLDASATPATFPKVLEAATALVNSLADDCVKAVAPIWFRVEVSI